MRRALLFMCVASMVACQGPPSAPPLWQSEHFEYASDREPLVGREAQAAAFEQHYESLSEAMGVALAPGDRIEYRQIDDIDAIRAWTGGYSAFYSPGPDLVLARSELDGHELVHAYAARAAVGVPS